MAKATWVLCIGMVLFTGMVLVPRHMERVAAGRCNKDLASLDLHMAVTTILDWAELHDGMPPSEWTGESMKSYELHPSTFVDPWGRDYAFQVSEDGVGFFLRTLGRDGVPGGVGLDMDKQVRFDARTRTRSAFDLIWSQGASDQTPGYQWRRAPGY